MPRARKSTATPPPLGDLPRLPELVIVGGRWSLAGRMREGGRTVQPRVAIWLEPESGFVRATRVINPAAGGGDGRRVPGPGSRACRRGWW